ncbi:MAG: AtpZ/AtpI family protein [Ruminococcaceae bacterium]|nr:AtpZ/AtpI family protein [Oscillospiraceae bacterium]
MHKKIFHFAYVMTFLSQTVFSFACPFGIWWLIGYLLHNKAGLGKWSLALCVVIGALLGVYSMFHYIITTVDWAAKEDKSGTAEIKKENQK